MDSSLSRSRAGGVALPVVSWVTLGKFSPPGLSLFICRMGIRGPTPGLSCEASELSAGLGALRALSTSAWVLNPVPVKRVSCSHLTDAEVWEHSRVKGGQLDRRETCPPSSDGQWRQDTPTASNHRGVLRTNEMGRVSGGVAWQRVHSPPHHVPSWPLTTASQAWAEVRG